MKALAILRRVFVGMTFCLAAGAALAQAPQEAAERAASAASASEASAVLAAKSAATAASAASGALGSAWSAPSSFWLVAIPALTFVAALLSMLRIQTALFNKSNWSLADALSEETQLTHYIETTTTDAAGNKVTVRDVAKDKDGKPIQITELRASTSRVIALLGMMVIVFLFVGFGVFAMFSFGATGALPDSMDTLIKFLASGMTLFAPYVVNKFASLFSGLTGSK